MKIPGTMWTALLIALPLLAVWLNESFPGAIWAAPVAGLFLIGAKVLEVVRAEPQSALPPGVDGSFAPRETRQDKISRVLWG